MDIFGVRKDKHLHLHTHTYTHSNTHSLGYHLRQKQKSYSTPQIAIEAQENTCRHFIVTAHLHCQEALGIE